MGWAVAFAVFTSVGTWLARRYALARDLVDAPGERRSHTLPTPRGGGAAIVAALIVASAVLGAREPGNVLVFLAFGISLIAVAAVGFVDDHRPLSPWVRLGVHIGASALFAVVLVATGRTPMEAVVAFAACVVLTNVWNFMDGINGLAASQAALIGAWLCFHGSEGWGALALAMSAACVGFLPFNFPKARIFLGDVGSGALGFAVAAAAVGPQRGALADHVPVLLMLAPFLIDTMLTLGRRVLRGERWWTPHTQHAYQVCSRRWGHTRVTLAYGCWAAAPCVAVSSFRLPQSGFFSVGSVAAWYTCGALLWLFIQASEHRSAEMDPADASNRERFTE